MRHRYFTVTIGKRDGTEAAFRVLASTGPQARELLKRSAYGNDLQYFKESRPSRDGDQKYLKIN